jgi:hypothetical protein
LHPMISRVARIATGGVLATILASAASAATFDLAGDWANASNPNGPWSYRVGTTLLPYTANNFIPGAPLPCAQGAYQPSSSLGNWLPALFRLNCDVSFGDAGDVMLHTNDNFNGNTGLGAGNFLFTAPIADVFDISGTVIDLGSSPPGSRPQDWQVLVNGSVQASGHLSGNGVDAQPFNLPDIALAVGDTVELRIIKGAASCCGNFVEVSMHIASSEVPEPATAWLVAAGLGLWHLRRRRASHAPASPA